MPTNKKTAAKTASGSKKTAAKAHKTAKKSASTKQSKGNGRTHTRASH